MFVMKLFKEDEDIEDVEPSPGPLKILEVMTKRTLMVLLSPLGNDLINFVSTIEQVSMNVASEAMQMLLVQPCHKASPNSLHLC